MKISRVFNYVYGPAGWLLGLVLVIVVVLISGCASGQQGQGATEAVVVHGLYTKEFTLNITGQGITGVASEATEVDTELLGKVKFPFSGLFTFIHDGDSDLTLQPTASGSAEATQTTSTEADLEVPLVGGG